MFRWIQLSIVVCLVLSVLVAAWFIKPNSRNVRILSNEQNQTLPIISDGWIARWNANAADIEPKYSLIKQQITNNQAIWFDGVNMKWTEQGTNYLQHVELSGPIENETVRFRLYMAWNILFSTLLPNQSIQTNDVIMHWLGIGVNGNIKSVNGHSVDRNHWRFRAVVRENKLLLTADHL